MDKYQSAILRCCPPKITFRGQEMFRGQGCGRVPSYYQSFLQSGKIILNQDADILLDDYPLRVFCGAAETCYLEKGSRKVKLREEERAAEEKKENPARQSAATQVFGGIRRDAEPQEMRNFCVKIDFSKPFDALRIVFKNNLADDLVIPLEYVPANREAYYAKAEKERQKNLEAAASVTCRTGSHLVNIYFKPCSENCASTEVRFFSPDGEVTKIAKDKYGRESSVKQTVWMPLKTIKAGKGENYVFLNNLAYGRYSFVLAQTDDKGRKLFETDHIEFKILPTQNSWYNVI